MVADFLANYTIDIQDSWSRTLDWPFQDADFGECTLMAHSDGGSRAGSGASSAWILEAGVLQGGEWVYKPLAMSGTYVGEKYIST